LVSSSCFRENAAFFSWSYSLLKAAAGVGCRLCAPRE
jgi:hypothetical protein